jgi:HEPN domain-containing protein
MTTYQPAFSREEYMSWLVKNKYATMRFYEASNDYAAARCCILNALFPGFALASQAIEKILKALIFFETGEKLMTGHDVFRLKENLKKSKDYGLDKYDDILKKLTDHFKSRYFENGAGGASTEELKDIDELWICLVKQMPMPDEILYRMKFFADLFSSSVVWQAGNWMKFNNQALASELTRFETRHKEVLEHPYKEAAS